MFEESVVGLRSMVESEVLGFSLRPVGIGMIEKYNIDSLCVCDGFEVDIL